MSIPISLQPLRDLLSTAEHACVAAQKLLVKACRKEAKLHDAWAKAGQASLALIEFDRQMYERWTHTRDTAK